jgi:hypothetical protein
MIYFAHPINTYNTELEEQCMQLIEETFPDEFIFNPSEDRVVNRFNEFRKKYPDTYMDFFKQLVRRCDKIVALPFRDGMIGAGIWLEVTEHYLTKGDVEIYCINPFSGQIGTVSYEAINSRKLSIEETRARIKNPY